MIYWFVFIARSSIGVTVFCQTRPTSETCDTRGILPYKQHKHKKTTWYQVVENEEKKKGRKGC